MSSLDGSSNGDDNEGLPRKDWLPFGEARGWARQSGVRSSREWMKADLPKGIPRSPKTVYKDKGWNGWKDWLETNWLSFEEAMEWARQSGIKNSMEWHKADLPKGIPRNPHRKYKDQWIDWYNWLGIDNKKWLSFKKARDWASQSGIKSNMEWGDSGKNNDLPDGIPCSPRDVYSDEWNGWRSFLGTEKLPFEEVRDWARQSGIKSKAEWYKSDLPEGIPRSTHFVYKDQWKGWKDFLGTEKANWLSFAEARELARQSGIKTVVEWNKADLPIGVPRCPNAVYKDEWKGWRDFLGKEKPS